MLKQEEVKSAKRELGVMDVEFGGKDSCDGFTDTVKGVINLSEERKRDYGNGKDDVPKVHMDTLKRAESKEHHHKTSNARVLEEVLEQMERSESQNLSPEQEQQRSIIDTIDPVIKVLLSTQECLRKNKIKKEIKKDVKEKVEKKKQIKKENQIKKLEQAESLSQAASKTLEEIKLIQKRAQTQYKNARLETVINSEKPSKGLSEIELNNLRQVLNDLKQENDELKLQKAVENERNKNKKQKRLFFFSFFSISVVGICIALNYNENGVVWLQRALDIGVEKYRTIEMWLS